ncbi:ATP-binding protein [Roseobacter sp. EG26]|uniref:ATP-binding protein n=1 Tax=Roseobacter sp. EG26 TaxID=3412477 RepID=UPI003CE4544E
MGRAEQAFIVPDEREYKLPSTFQTNQQNSENTLIVDAFGAMSLGVILFDPEMRFLLCNDQYLDFFSSGTVQPPKENETARDIATRYFRDGRFDATSGFDVDGFLELISTCGKDLVVTRRDGRRSALSSHQTSLGNYLVSCSELTALYPDIEAQANLAVVNDAIQALDEILVMFDSDLKFVMANELYYEAFFSDYPRPAIGESAANILARMYDVEFFILPDVVTKELFIQGAIADMGRYLKDSIFETTDNRAMTASIHKTALDGYLISFKDITEQRTANERALATVTDAIQALDEALVLFDADLGFVMANRRWYELFIKELPAPEVGENATALIRRLLDSGFFALPQDLGEKKFIQTVLKNVKNYAKNIRTVTRDGSILEGSAHKTALGGYLLSFNDVTDILTMQEELEHQRVVAHQNEKLSALGELLAGVAHELNNPLSIIVGYAQMLEGTVTDPVVMKRVDRISQAADRSAKIVKTFLAMARQRPTQIESCSINEIVTTALDIAGYGLRSIGTEIELSLDQSVPMVTGDADQLAQVFTNLIVNAEHALANMGGDGKLCLHSYFDASSDHVLVEVKDNGPGISKDIQSRIFEPFFTTKEVGKGTGIGLAFCYRIIKTHEGFLNVHSTEQEGCCFQVGLRASRGDVAELTDDAPKRHSFQSEHILVVDDEVDVAELLADLLSVAGHTVRITNNADDALKRLKAEEFSAVLCDFKMPDIDGEEFFRLISVHAPGYLSRIGFITGDIMSKKVAEFLKRTGRPHIEKPFASDELDELISQLGVTR